MIIRSDIYVAIIAAAAKYGQPKELIGGIISVESGFNPGAIGDNGDSFGLMQLNIYGAGAGYSRETLLDINSNVDIGTGYIHWLLGYYNLDWRYAISAYNQGIGGVERNGVDYNKAYVDNVRSEWLRFLAEGLWPEEGAPPPVTPPPVTGCDYAADITNVRIQLAGAGWGGGSDLEALCKFLQTVAPGSQPRLVDCCRQYIDMGGQPCPGAPLPPPTEPPPVEPGPVPSPPLPPSSTGLRDTLYNMVSGVSTIRDFFYGLADDVRRVPIVGNVTAGWFDVIGDFVNWIGLQMFTVGDGLQGIVDTIGQPLDLGAIWRELVRVHPLLAWTQLDIFNGVRAYIEQAWPLLSLNAWGLVNWLEGALKSKFPLLSFNYAGLLDWLRPWLESWWPQLNLSPWGFVWWLRDSLLGHFPVLELGAPWDTQWWREFVRYRIEELLDGAVDWVQDRATRVLDRIW